MTAKLARDPAKPERIPGIYALLNKKRRIAYVSYTDNLQMRSHSLQHMLLNQADKWSITALPKHPIEEWSFVVVESDKDKLRNQGLIDKIERIFERKNYAIVKGSRPPVTYGVKRLNLAELMVEVGCKDEYSTVWKRIQRGWTHQQATGVHPAPER